MKRQLPPKLVRASRSQTEESVESGPTTRTFTSKGVMLIDAGNANPVFFINPDQTHNVLFKGILSTAAEKLIWGNETNHNMIVAGTEYNSIKTKVAMTGAPYNRC